MVMPGVFSRPFFSDLSNEVKNPAEGQLPCTFWTSDMRSKKIDGDPSQEVEISDFPFVGDHVGGVRDGRKNERQVEHFVASERGKEKMIG